MGASGTRAGGASAPTAGSRAGASARSVGSLARSGRASRAAPVAANPSNATRASAHRSHVASPNVSKVLSHTASSSSSAAPRESLLAVQNLPERWCVHCRGPHVRNRSHPRKKMSVEERAREHDRGVSEFGKLYAASKLPAEKNSGSFGGADALRWKKQGWPDVDFDVETWLPIFVGGARETAEPQRMIAIQGSKQMMRQPTERILPMIPVLVPALRSCLNTYNPPAVAAALDLVRFLLTNHEGAVDTLIACDGFRRLLPAPNALANCKTRVRTGYDLKMMGGQQQRLDLLIDEVLALMAKLGGDKGLRLIKSYIPTFDPNAPKAEKRR